MNRTVEPDLDLLEELMDAAWPAIDRAEMGPWVLRSSGSVTQRANSIWPRGDVQTPAQDQEQELRPAMSAVLDGATDWYHERRQPVIFQITERAQNQALEDLLDAERYSTQSVTLVMTTHGPFTDAAQTDRPGLAVELAPEPDDEWLALWWQVDGRGGDADLATARGIITGSPAVYATVRSTERHDAGPGTVLGVGRLALAEGWAGLYCMAVHPDARRRGIGTAVLDALLAEGTRRGISNFWLMVTVANKGAQDLYAGRGFTEAMRYHYRQAPLRRAPSGC